MKKLNGSPIFPLLILFLFFQVNADSQTTGYKLVKKIPIGGETHWDYIAVDSTYNRLFVSHSSSVAVIDLSDYSLITEIKNLSGVHGIVFAPEFGKGFISNGRDSSVTVFYLKSLKVLDKISITGKNPDAILYDPYSKKVFTMNGRSDNATVIDAESDKVTGTIKLDGRPEEARTNNDGKIFINIENKSEIEEIDVQNFKVLNIWSLSPGEGPSGLAIDTKSDRLFSVCGNKTMVIMDSKSGKIIKTLPVGSHVDGCAFDEEDGLIFSSNGEGNITVVKEESPDIFTVIDNVATEKGARTIAFDAKTKRIFTDTAAMGENDTKVFTVLVFDKK